MWKPDAVVPEHRWRARMVWVSLLVCITAYTIWQIWKIFDELANPSTSLKITNDLYAYPYVLVCFFHGRGCGFADGTTDTCVASAFTEGFATVDFNGEIYDDVAAYNVDSNNCVGFDLGSLEFGDDITAEEDQIIIDMWWYQSDMASDETDYYNHIGIHMAEEYPTESTLPFLFVPYARIVAGVSDITYKHTELGHVMSGPFGPLLAVGGAISPRSLGAMSACTCTRCCTCSVRIFKGSVSVVFLSGSRVCPQTIGKTTKKNLDGDVTTTFPPLVLSSSDFFAEETWTTSEDDTLADDAFGRLYLDIQQGAYSRTSIAEVDPLDIGTFLGNIGGFWELLLVLWGLFFIATREEREPKMKARDFAKTARTTKEIVTRRRSLSVDSAAASTTSAAVEQRPQWEAAFRGDTAAVPQFGGGNTAVPTVPSVNDGGASTATRRASNDSSGNGSTSSALFRRSTGGISDPHGGSSSSNFRRPVVRDMPRRGSTTGGSLPEEQPRAPPSYDEMSAK
ncbi:unnamed protein product [Ectocarpus sp. 4 AP-2014]